MLKNQKTIYKLFSILIFISTHFMCMSQGDSINFSLPVKIPLSFSSSFGEFRANHFHAGIDIRTNGKEGIKIYSIDEGYVSRIKISPWSYGNTLYIDHPNGYTSVYAHLKSFNPKIEEYTKQLQYKNKEYAIDLMIEKDKLKVSKEEFIALSGNTGRSFGPHLHFEIRETLSEFPVDPFQFYPQIKDNLKPNFKALYTYEFVDSSIESSKRTKYIVYGSNGKYYLSKTINVSRYTGFGIEALDYINGSSNKCGIKSITLSIDSAKTYEFVLDKFSYYEKRYINALIDFEYYINKHNRISKLFVEPGNKFSFYQNVIEKGVYNFNDNKPHNVECLISDYRGNVSKLTFKVKNKQDTVTDKKNIITESNKMYYNKENIFENNSIKVLIPDSVLYNTIDFKFDISEKKYRSISPIYHIHENTTPLHNNIILSIKVDSIPDSLQNKLLIANLTKHNKLISYGGEYKNGWLTAKPNVFGKFMVLIDTIAPKISSTDIFDGAKFKNDNDIIFKITDNLSGIKSYNGFVDGKWILFKFKPKKNRIIYTFDDQTSKTDQKHNFSLEVMDERGNKAIFETFFYY